MSQATKQVRQLTNKRRAQANRRPLKSSRLLNISARSKARHLAKTGKLEHGTWWTRFARKVRKPWGENIARGQNTPAQVVNEWMDSPKHRDNILGAGYKSIGVGFAKKGETEYWVQHFGG